MDNTRLRGLLWALCAALAPLVPQIFAAILETLAREHFIPGWAVLLLSLALPGWTGLRAYKDQTISKEQASGETPAEPEAE